MKGTFALLVFTLLLTSCGPDVVYQHSEDFSSDGWPYADSVSFSFPIADTTSRYDLVLTVDHTQDFVTQNFYVRLSTHLPDGTVLTQPLSLQLADKYGEWYGDCDSESCSVDISIQEGTRFIAPGDYRLAVSQFSREDPLPEVTAIGFRIVKQ